MNPNGEKHKDLVAINGNDGQLPMIQCFIDSLRDPSLGDYHDEVLVVSTCLSERVKNYLHGIGVMTYEAKIEEAWDWEHRKNVSAFEYANQPSRNSNRWSRQLRKFFNRTAINKSLNDFFLFDAYVLRIWSKIHRGLDRKFDDLFEVWHRKHLSKLNLIHFLESTNKNFDQILVCDADMVIQSPLQRLFELNNERQLCVVEELEPILPGESPVYGSNALTVDYDFHSKLRMGKDAHEVNVGVFWGPSEVILREMRKWRDLMFNPDYSSLWTMHRRHFWHEQDFFRLLCDLDRERVKVMTNHEVYHACNLAEAGLELKDGVFVVHNGTIKPTIAHFAGGAWKKFDFMVDAYSRSVDSILNK